MARRKSEADAWDISADGETLSPGEIEEKAFGLLLQMTLAEKVAQMTGDLGRMRGSVALARAYGVQGASARPIPAADGSRLGIPAIHYSDGPRGVVLERATCFPVSMARGATWDVELEARVGDAMGVEARSLGANILAAVCINVLRHPAWGRAQETYGEDPYHLGEMGAAAVGGIQRHVMACVKHFAGNSIENSRMKVNVRVSERALREIYLRHFKRCVDAGAASVMSAYNRLNGEYCGHNVRLLREILKEEWGFDGFVMSDFVFGMRDARSAALAGLDLEMPFRWHYANDLQKLVDADAVPEALVDEAVMRILRQKIRFAQVGEPGRYGRQHVAGEAHRALAREVAQKSIVLLKNDAPEGGTAPVLPLDAARLSRLAVVGRLAVEPNIGDAGSSRVRPPAVSTPLDGIRRVLEGNTALIQETSGKPQAAADAARAADAAIVVVGYTLKDEGEHLTMLGYRTGGDRVSLYLKPEDEALIQAVASVNPRTVVVIMAGSAVITERWRDRVAGIVMAWYPGMEGGAALADILFGAVNPSGKLPCVFPRAAEHLPPFDPAADEVEYGYWHGYRLLDHDGHDPAFAFGHGLSYTTFAYANLRLSAPTVAYSGAVAVSVEVTNIGARAGDEVVQLYVGYPETAVERPARELKAFARVSLAPGETQTVTLELPARRLAFWDEERNRWWVEAVRHTVLVGPSSRAADLLAADLVVTEA